MKRRITQNRSTSVTLDAPPGVSLRGGADSITPRSAIKSGDVTYMVKITLADSDPRLQWGYDGPRRRSGQAGARSPRPQACVPSPALFAGEG